MAVAQHLPQGRSQAGDRHLNFHETRDNLLRGWANYFRHGVSKAIFNAIDSYTWERITNWLRKKHRIGWPELRRRYCLPGTWRLTHDGERFRGAASVTVIRYRYRGYQIPTPWTPKPAALTS